MKRVILMTLFLTCPMLGHANNETASELESLARGGDTEAAYQLGLLYYSGKSETEHGIWVAALAEVYRQNDRWSILTLDTDYLADKTFDALIGDNEPDAITRAEILWRNLDTSAQLSVQRDESVKNARESLHKRYAKSASKWFTTAAKNGHSGAQYYLGVLYARGDGVRRNSRTAGKWFRAAADQGYAAAESVLGDNYALGQGVDAEPATALEWYRRAASSGDPTAVMLVECVEDSSLLDQNMVAHSYENKTHLYREKSTGELFTGCTWDRSAGGSNPTLTRYSDGLWHGARVKWKGGPAWQQPWRKYSEDYYERGLKHGLSSTWTFDNEQKSIEVTFADGEEEGVKRWWYEDGTPYAEVTFVGGKEQGLYVSWYQNGNKEQEVPYVDGKRSGEAISWHENGRKASLTTMQDGRAEGPQLTWYENGQKQSEGSVDSYSGIRYGAWTEYYDNGQIRFVADYLWSRQTGKFEHTRPELGSLDEPKRVYWSDWDESGQQISEGLYTGFDLRGIGAPVGSNLGNTREGNWIDWKADGRETRSCWQSNRHVNFGTCETPEDPPPHLFERAEPSATYTLYGNLKNNGFPVFDPETSVVTLTPVHVFGGAGVAFLKDPVEVPFVVSFEFNIWDDDGGKLGKNYNSADGISVIFSPDDSAYRTQAPPSGQRVGYIQGDSTMALMFKTYESRRVELRDASGVLAKKRNGKVYTGRNWQKAQVTVRSDGIELTFDDKTVISWQGTLPFETTSIAFGAGTGGSNSRHQVRNVEVRPVD